MSGGITASRTHDAGFCAAPKRGGLTPRKGGGVLRKVDLFFVRLRFWRFPHVGEGGLGGWNAVALPGPS